MSDALAEALIALADDAETLARLHDRELDAPALDALRGLGFPANLALLPAGEATRSAWQEMAAALPSRSDPAMIDALAVDYAAIYLTGAYRASPTESPWLDDDRLTCQQAMFDLRSIYREVGLKAANWRWRSDDHLVLQLLFVSHCLRSSAGADALHKASEFLTRHLLNWLPRFVAQVVLRAEHDFYPALSNLTLSWCEQIREMSNVPIAENQYVVE